MRNFSESKWPWRRLKTLAYIVPSGVDKKSNPDELPVRLCNYVDVYRNERITDQVAFMEATASALEIGRLGLKEGDVLVTKDSETPDDIAVPAYVEQSAAGVVCGYHLALLRPIPDRISGRFLYWALKGGEVAAQFTVRAQGVTRFGLTVGGIGNVRIPCPSIAQQEAVADFLDREVGNIDSARRDYQQLTTLLEEKIQAIASTAVEDAGRRWPHVRLRRALSGIQQGWSPLAEDRRAEGEEWAVIKLSAVKRGRFYPDSHKVLSSADEPLIDLEIREGDLLLSRANTLELVGDACVVNNPPRRLMISDLIYRLMPNKERACAEYLGMWFLTREARSQIEADARGSSLSMVKISHGHIRQWLLPLPPLEEQIAIARHVGNQQSQLRTAVEAVQEALSRLDERRSSLIASATTGQIAVGQLESIAEVMEAA
ncbi:MAG: hypothetical protein NVS2B16_33550 [Chloroflexota bacterium]